MTGANAPLRVGLLLNSVRQPAWVCRIVDDVIAAPHAELALVIENAGPTEETDTRTSREKLRDHRRQLLYILYRKLDSRLFRPRPDAFATEDLTERLVGVPVIRVTPERRRFSDYFPDEALSRIAEHRLDVALRFGFRILRKGALHIATYGVWSHHHGDNLLNRGGPAGFWEVMEAHPTTGSILQVLTEDLDNGAVICRSYAKTDRRSVARNRNSYYWKTSAFVGRKLREVHETGPAALARDQPSRELRPYAAPLYVKPTNARMASLLWDVGRRAATERLDRALYLDQWMLAYKLKKKSREMETSFHRLTPVIPPKDRFWADPFPVEHEGRHYIFIEELVYSRGRGWISVMPIDEKGRWETPVKVLERDYHLSYPFTFRHDGTWYMIPETQANRTVEMYRCKRFPDEWEPHSVLLKDVDAVDATLAEVDGRHWLFVNIAERGAPNYDELHVFHSSSPFGPFTPHPMNPVRSDVRLARPAGKLFRWNGALHRPAQDCSRRYGWAITFNRIDKLTPTEYIEHEVSKVLPTWHPNLVATHTFNFEAGLTVVDGRLRRPKLGG